MSRPRVYLAGPISGSLHCEATDWRDGVAIELARRGVETVSPMRGKDALKSVGVIEGSYEGGDPFAKQAGIIARDRNDVRTCDVILVNLLPMGTRVSIGSIIELGWADAFRIPIVLVRKPMCLSQHPMVNALVGFDVLSLTEGANCAATLVNR